MNKSIQYYFFNGEFISNDTPVLTPYELGMLRGYGIFDFLRIVDGVPMFLEDHLDRFFNSAKAMDLKVPYNRKQIIEFIDSLVQINNVGYSGVRLVLTGGFAKNGFTSIKPNFYLLQHILKENPSSYFRQGIKLITVDYIRDVPKIKTLNYGLVLSMQTEIKKRKAFDALFVKDDIISESSRSNFFIVKKSVIITSEENALSGITRKQVLELTKNRYRTEVRPIHIKELKTADEAFICGSTKPLVPVTRVDDIKIGNGKPGKFTARLRMEFKQRQRDYIQERLSNG